MFVIVTATLIITGTMSPINDGYLPVILENQISWGHIPPDAAKEYKHFFAVGH